MKRRLSLLAGVLLLPSIACAGELTNPALPVPTGKFSLGLEYFFNNGSYEPTNPAFKNVRTESNQIYARGAYGAFDGNEMFIKLGTANFRHTFAFEDESEFNPAFGFSAAAGMKQSYEVMPDVRIGGIVQYTYFSYFEQSKPNQYIKVFWPWQVDLALAATYMGEGWAPYIGPVISWHRFQTHDKALGWTVYKEANLGGGVVGLELWNGPYPSGSIRGNFKGNVEVQISSQVSAGLTLNYLFQ